MYHSSYTFYMNLRTINTTIHKILTNSFSFQDILQYPIYYKLHHINFKMATRSQIYKGFFLMKMFINSTVSSNPQDIFYLTYK